MKGLGKELDSMAVPSHLSCSGTAPRGESTL
jgi:hypothetical protein